jgi:hypothetical protein
MRTHSRHLVALAALLSLHGCSDDPAQPEPIVCDPELTSVTAFVSSGLSPVLDWEPACPVALVLVEEGGHDKWGIMSDEAGWDQPATANIISPPVTYGVVPDGLIEIPNPEALEPGVTYELILWSILPAGSTAECQMRWDDACLLTVHPFTR